MAQLQQNDPSRAAQTERGWLALCRPGFEAECGQDLVAAAAAAGAPAGYLRARTDTGLAEWLAVDAGAVPMPPALAGLVFARQAGRLLARCPGLATGDRVGPIVAAAVASGGRWHEVLVETADSDGGRELAPLARALTAPLASALRAGGRLKAGSDLRLHVVMVGTDQAVLMESALAGSAPWPGGIPRLRRLAGAPSRSAAKLDEALATMLDDGERERYLQPGMSAVDLGAAPGGWTWVLARRHLKVTAIDNGPLAAQVLENPLVTHVRADGFHWRPARPVDWLVCDMVEQPSRIATLAGRWFADGACRRAVVNLKLPMKKRHAEVVRCLDLLRDAAGRPLDLRCRQLYHDREEVTLVALTSG
jgi:23S rRNA (cytidine2498-2'-O)-methyltransferase